MTSNAESETWGKDYASTRRKVENWAESEEMMLINSYFQYKRSTADGSDKDFFVRHASAYPSRTANGYKQRLQILKHDERFFQAKKYILLGKGLGLQDSTEYIEKVMLPEKHQRKGPYTKFAQKELRMANQPNDAVKKNRKRKIAGRVTFQGVEPPKKISKPLVNIDEFTESFKEVLDSIEGRLVRAGHYVTQMPLQGYRTGDEDSEDSESVVEATQSTEINDKDVNVNPGILPNPPKENNTTDAIKQNFIGSGQWDSRKIDLTKTSEPKQITYNQHANDHRFNVSAPPQREDEESSFIDLSVLL